MSDAERALNTLLHDLRTPIGVAQGYLRMIQDGRLSTPEDRDRAIGKALDALRKTAEICDAADRALELSKDRTG